MTERVEQLICIKFCIKLEHISMETDDAEGCSYGQLVIGSFIATMHPLMHHVSCRVFQAKHQITQVTLPHYSPDLASCDFWLFLKLKSPLKGKRFQTITEVQENTTGQLMVIGRTMWGPEVPTLKGTKASLSYVQWFLYHVSFSINASIFILHSWIHSGKTSYVCFYKFKNL